MGLYDDLNSLRVFDAPEALAPPPANEAPGDESPEAAPASTRKPREAAAPARPKRASAPAPKAPTLAEAIELHRKGMVYLEESGRVLASVLATLGGPVVAPPAERPTPTEPPEEEEDEFDDDDEDDEDDEVHEAQPVSEPARATPRPGSDAWRARASRHPVAGSTASLHPRPCSTHDPGRPRHRPRGGRA